MTRPSPGYLFSGLTLLTAGCLLGFGDWSYALSVRLAMGAAVLAGVGVWATVWRWRPVPGPGDRRWLVLAVAVGIVTRLVLMPAGFELSDDAARYHWDGKVLAHRINPYLFAPDSPQLAHLRHDAIDARVNHPDSRTCYPPAAQILFAAGYRLAPHSLRGLQAIFLLAELLTWWVLWRGLQHLGRSPAWLLLVVWSPLLIFQGYLPGHVDLLAMPFVALLLVAVLNQRPRRAGIWLAAACLIKPLPLIMVPAIARELGWRRTSQMLLVSALVVLAAYVPFRSAGGDLFASLWLMATDWSFNGSGGAVLELIMPRGAAHLLAAAGIVAAALVATWRGPDFLGRALGAWLGFVIFTPTLFPWYLMGALPLLVLRSQPALLALIVTIPLADQVMIAHQSVGVWQEDSWVRMIEYGAFYGTIVVGLWRKQFTSE